MELLNTIIELLDSLFDVIMGVTELRQKSPEKHARKNESKNRKGFFKKKADEAETNTQTRQTVIAYDENSGQYRNNLISSRSTHLVLRNLKASVDITQYEQAEMQVEVFSLTEAGARAVRFEKNNNGIILSMDKNVKISNNERIRVAVVIPKDTSLNIKSDYPTVVRGKVRSVSATLNGNAYFVLEQAGATSLNMNGSARVAISRAGATVLDICDSANVTIGYLDGDCKMHTYGSAIVNVSDGKIGRAELDTNGSSKLSFNVADMPPAVESAKDKDTEKRFDGITTLEAQLYDSSSLEVNAKVNCAKLEMNRSSRASFDRSVSDINAETSESAHLTLLAVEKVAKLEACDNSQIEVQSRTNAAISKKRSGMATIKIGTEKQ